MNLKVVENVHFINNLIKNNQAMKAVHIELAVATLFNYRKNIIIPNLSWGADLHECDILIINPKGVATEVEIKVSRQDLIADFKKKHEHRSNRIKHLYYAIPSNLLDTALPVIPAEIGIILCYVRELNEGQIRQDRPMPIAFVHRKCTQKKPLFTPFSEKEMINIIRLGTMRIWNLKSKLIKNNIL